MPLFVHYQCSPSFVVSVSTLLFRSECDDDRHFLLADGIYCWNLLYRNTISALFCFEFISYCAYLIIVFIHQFWVRGSTCNMLLFICRFVRNKNIISQPVHRHQARSCFNYHRNEWARAAIEKAPLISNYKLKRIFWCASENCETRHQKQLPAYLQHHTTVKVFYRAPDDIGGLAPFSGY